MGPYLDPVTNTTAYRYIWTGNNSQLTYVTAS
jgi:hypothetical protein